MTRSKSLTAFALAILATAPSFAQQSTASRPAGAIASSTTVATVQSIDKEDRQVTLRKEDGSLVTLIASEEMRNFDQLEKGDRVTATYDVGLVVALGPPGAQPQRVDDIQTERAPPGGKPGGVFRQTIAVTATVVAIDPRTRTVTLKGSNQTVSLPVAADVDLGKLKVGDQVAAAYQQSLAIRVDAAKD